MPTPLAPRPMQLALIRNYVTRPRVSPFSTSSPHLTQLSISVQGLRPNQWVERRGAFFKSGLSAAAPEVPPDVESGSGDRGVPGGSKDKSAKRNAGEEEGRGEGEGWG